MVLSLFRRSLCCVYDFLSYGVASERIIVSRIKALYSSNHKLGYMLL